MSSISLKGVSKRFGDVQALKELDLEVQDGEFLSLLGPSGCGKTTTLRLVAGLEEPTSGEIYMDEDRVTDLAPADRDIAMVFQLYALYPYMTIRENIAFPLRAQGVNAAETRRRVDAVAELLGIEDLLSMSPSQVHPAQGQRVAIAKAVVREPRVFLFDEPLSHLDAHMRARMRAELKHLHDTVGRTTLFVTHDQAEGLAISDRIGVMRAGVIEQEGTPMQIYSDPKSYFVADFFGSPSMNLTDGEIIAQDGKPVFKNGHMELPVPELYKGKVSGNVTLGIRPEHVVVEEKSGQVPDTIDLVEPMGKETLLYFEAGEERPFIVIVEGLADDELQSGQDVKLTFPEDKVFFFDKEGQRIR